MNIRIVIENRPGNGRSGFTLIEALVGFAVAGIAMFTLYAGITYGVAVTQATRENLRATQLIMEKFETIRLYTWEQMNGSNGFVIPQTFTETYAVDPQGAHTG